MSPTEMLLYRSWLATSVMLILVGTAWISAGESTGPYFAYSMLALLAFGLRLADGSSMGFVFILLAVPHLAWRETLLLASSAIFIYAVTQPERLDPRALLRLLCTTALAVIGTHAAFNAISLTKVPAAPRLMIASCVCFASMHTFRWTRAHLWSFPYYPVAAAIVAMFPPSVAIAPLVLLTWFSYRLYERRLSRQTKQSTEVTSLNLRTIETLALAIEAKDQPLAGHSRRVRIYAVEMAKELGLVSAEIEALRAASLLYDIGELAVPEHIILKRGPLTPEEFEKVKIHPLVAADILDCVKFPYPVAPIVLAHHERWDGTGYPRGLKGEEIPIGARILAAVDAVDALASLRFHRDAITVQDAVERVVAEGGRAFDPKIVALLRKRHHQWEKLVNHWEKTLAGAPEYGFLDSIFAARREANILFELTNRLAISLDLQDTFGALKPALRQLVPSGTFAIWIERDGYLNAEYVSGSHVALYTPLRIPLNAGVSGWVASHGQPVTNGNAGLDLSAAGIHDWSPFPLALSVPLADDGLRGALTLYRTGDSLFTAEDARVVSSIAPKLSMALANGLKFRRAADEATTDSLTGLPNAAALCARMACNDQPISVVVCDLDGFKRINDRFGHVTGNRLLETMADRFRRSCRQGDFIARLGGDEFVLLLPCMNMAEVSPRIAQFRELVRVTGREICGEDLLDGSFGAAFFPQDGTTTDELLAAADRRMYRHKSERRAGVLPIDQQRSA